MLQLADERLFSSESGKQAKRVFSSVGDEFFEDVFDLIEPKEVLYISCGEDWVLPATFMEPAKDGAVDKDRRPPPCGDIFPPRAPMQPILTSVDSFSDMHASPSCTRPPPVKKLLSEGRQPAALDGDVHVSPSCMRLPSASPKSLEERPASFMKPAGGAKAGSATDLQRLAMAKAADVHRSGFALTSSGKELKEMNDGDVHISPAGMRSGGSASDLQRDTMGVWAMRAPAAGRN